MAINLAFAADVRGFLRGTSDIESELDKVADSLDDVGDAGKDIDKSLGKSLENVGDEAKQAGNEIGDRIEKGAEQAVDSVKSLEKKFRDAFDDVNSVSKKAGNDIGDNVRKGTKRASDGMDELKDESQSTAKEAAASFDGSADSIMDAFQEVAANAFIGFGPAGLAAGLGIAAGIGIGITALQASADEAAATKEKIIDLADSIRDAGGDINDIDWGDKFREFGNEIADAKSWFEPWQKAAVTNFEKIQDAADRFGLDYADLFQGMAGDTEAAERSLGALNAEIARGEQKLAGMEQATDRMSRAQRDARADERIRIGDLKDLRDQLEENTGLTEEAIEHERRYGEAYKGSAAELKDKNDALEETLSLTSQVIGSELDYLDTLEQTTAALAENASAGFDKNTAAGRDNLRALGEIAQAALDYAEATEESTGSQAAANEKIYEGRNAVIDAGKALGMSQEQAEEYAKSLGLIPREVSTKAKADTQSAEDRLNDVARRRESAIVAMAETEHAQIALNRLASKTVYVNVTPRVGNMRVV